MLHFTVFLPAGQAPTRRAGQTLTEWHDGWGNRAETRRRLGGGIGKPTWG